MDVEYPYIELGRSVVETLKFLETQYPANIHEWRHHSFLIHGTTSNLEYWIRTGKTDKSKERYDDLVKYVDEALAYIDRYIKL